MSRPLSLPKELTSGFRVWVGSLSYKYPNTSRETIEKLAYKYLHTEMLADWLLWKVKNRDLFVGR